MRIKNFTMKGLVLGLLLSLGVNAANASENIRINRYLDTDYSVVSILNPSESAMRMKIYSRDGELLYFKNVEGESVMQQLFDFSQLANGTYRIVLSGEDARFEKKFAVEDRKLAIKTPTNPAEKTLFKSQKDALFVSYISIEKKDIRLSIADASGNKVFDANYSSDPIFQRKFDISALPEGQYKVRVVSDEKAYHYAFKK